MVVGKERLLMYVILVYDIVTDDAGKKILPKVFKICKKYLSHYQKSVFRGDMTPSKFIKLKNEFLPFLYPNQYVDFSEKSQACKLARSLVTKESKDVDMLKTFYTYITTHITYDYHKAETVEAGYLPNVDETLKTGTGICFDYAALLTAMLRSQDIPCKLEIGYSGDIKHAWVDVYIRDKGWVTKAASFDGDTWELMDPTFDANSSDNEAIQEYIGDESNYTVQYTY